jgi:flagellar motility protein MotE (MotC chaperone)
MKILMDVATQINPRRMSDILAQMSPEAAEKLTVELANNSKSSGDKSSIANLPKIEGKPGG